MACTRHKPGRSQQVSKHLLTLRTVLLAILISLASACSAPPDPPVRLVLNPWIGYDPFVLARERGLIAAESLRVVELMSYAETLRLFRNGMAEAAAMTLGDALHLMDQGVELQIILLLSESHGADAVLVALDIQKIADLQNKRLGLEDSAVSRLLLATMLDSVGMGLKDVTLVHTEAHQHRKVLRLGEIDGIATFEPMRTKLQSEGYHQIFDSSAMEGEIVDVVVVHPKVSGQARQLIREAWRVGLQAMNHDRMKAAQALAPALDLTDIAYVAALDGLRFFEPEQTNVRLTPHSMATTHASLVDHMQAIDLLGNPPDWNRLLSPE